MVKIRSITLDLLRIFAAFWVMAYHWSGHGKFTQSLKSPIDISWFPKHFEVFFNTGLLGVDVFFILSGAVIAKSALSSTSFRFAESRFLRLFPVFFLCTSIAVFLTPVVANGFSPPEKLISLEGIKYLLNLPDTIMASWTLKLEVGFYTLVFLSLFLASRLKRSFNEHLLYIFFHVYLSVGLLAILIPSDKLAFLQVNNFGAYFVLGGSISQMNSCKLFWKYSGIFLVSLFLTGMSLFDRTPWINHRLQVSLIVLFVTVAVVASGNFERPQRPFLRMHRAIKTLSLMTYPIYLSHETLGLSLVSLLNRAGVGIRFSFFIVFISVICFSYFQVKYYEPSFRKYFKRYLSRRS